MGNNKLPCPKCGDLPLLQLVHFVPSDKIKCADYYFACPNCQGMIGEAGKTIASARRKWNRFAKKQSNKGKSFVRRYK